MNVLLVSPPWLPPYFPSCSIGALAGYLKKHAVNVNSAHLHVDASMLIDPITYACLFESNILRDNLALPTLFPATRKSVIRYYKPFFNDPEKLLHTAETLFKTLSTSTPWERYDLIGFTIDNDQLFTSLVLAKAIKKRFPHIRIVFGGVLAGDIFGESLLKHFDWIDYCIWGEGEIPLLELSRGLASGDPSFELRSPGLIYRNGANIECNHPLEADSLDDLPDPDYDDFFERIRRLGCNPMVQILVEGSRSCVHRCAFCNERHLSRKYRRRTPARIVAMLRNLSKRYGSLNFLFTDSELPQKVIPELCKRLIAENTDFRLCADIHADNPAINFEWLLKAGFNNIEIGIESLSQGLLTKMNKKTSVIDNLHALKRCGELGIPFTWLLILRFPTETQRDIYELERNIAFASGFQPPMDISYFTLYKGSLVHENPAEYKIKLRGSNPEEHPLLPSKIKHTLESFRRTYTSDRKPNNYNNLMKVLQAWQQKYFALRANDEFPLSYQVGCDFVNIFDQRKERLVYHRFEGIQKDVFLFCDDIRHINDILSSFKKADAQLVRQTLSYCVRHRIMFSQNNRYLSLAIRNAPAFTVRHIH